MPDPAYTSQIQSKHAKSPSHAVTLLILLADTPIPAVRERHPSYHDVFTSLFQRSLDAHPEHGLDDVLLTIKSYDVVTAQAYPDDAELSEAKAVLITGSGRCSALADHQSLLIVLSQPPLHTKTKNGSTS